MKSYTEKALTYIIKYTRGDGGCKPTRMEVKCRAISGKQLKRWLLDSQAMRPFVIECNNKGVDPYDILLMSLLHTGRLKLKLDSNIWGKPYKSKDTPRDMYIIGKGRGGWNKRYTDVWM